MKMNVKSTGKIALSVIVCGFFIMSCSNTDSSSDTNPATTVNGTDTALPVNPDSMTADHTRLPPPVDTSNNNMMAKPDTMAGTKIDTSTPAGKKH